MGTGSLPPHLTLMPSFVSTQQVLRQGGAVRHPIDPTTLSQPDDANHQIRNLARQPFPLLRTRPVGITRGSGVQLRFLPKIQDLESCCKYTQSELHEIPHATLRGLRSQEGMHLFVSL